MDKFVYDKTEQGHGHAFESMVKAGFPGSSNSKRLPNEQFDIEKKFDKYENLPTSVKSTKGKTVCLADARGIFDIKEDFRLVIVEYEQKGSFKEPSCLKEYKITQDAWQNIKGNIPNEEVNKFHEDLKHFPQGQHIEARRFARDKNQAIKEQYNSSIALNPKIDSKNQRRLQASIRIEKLEKHVSPTVIEAQNGIVMYRGTCIGKIESAPRNLKENKKTS